ncbi:hypothetical protein FGG08_007219 [Glutinoglossum americanum]|uniref:Glycogen debranching enzyme n=1 Tax=Glutinoglossum americanum TaxID=1670608 RepID=A0A9P8KU69_9PEZI|nr:hypothetical protein FGG08_007219 [Glutinoglossum americanum]
MTTADGSTSNEVYRLPLTDTGAPAVPGGYICLPPPTDPAYLLRFAIEGTSSICRQGSLWVNIPAVGEQFRRSKFREYKLHPDFNRTLEISIPIHFAGAFAFYTTFTPLPKFSTSTADPPSPMKTDTYYVNVSPRITLNGKTLRQDALSTFSVISKFMGSDSTRWDDHIRGIGRRGYNIIHFTPLMERGASNSPYSIYNQLAFDPICFPNGEGDIADLTTKMEKEHGLLGLTDVVWNHTAHNSQWLQEHPEAGYNITTAPWLEPALELDTALLKFSKNLKTSGFPTTLTSIKDLLEVMEGVKLQVINSLCLWEFYVVDVDRNAGAAAEAWMAGDAIFPEGGFGVVGIGGLEGVKGWSLKRKAQFLREKGLRGNDRLGERFRRRIDPKIGAALLTVLHGRYDGGNLSSTDEAAVRSAYSRILDEVNLPYYKEYDAESSEIQEQIFNRVKYMRLDDHGPKVGAITEQNPLVESYFTRLPVNAKTEKHDPRSLSLVNNGWIWNADAMVDHAGPGSRAYLRREVIVWGDCVKLRYGDSPTDNPFLWNHMAEYTRLMAKYFAGFRIDNCHSTPLVVGEYLLDEARRVRSNLLVCAELFTGSEEMDYRFVKRLGLSCLIREAMQAWSTKELSRIVHRHGGRPIGSFEVDEVVRNNPKQSLGGSADNKREIVRTIKESPVHALFMDCTHDNELPAQKRDARDTLPNAALVSMCACAIGSVMGYDEVYPKLVDLVNETRSYASPSSSSEAEPEAGGSGIGGIKKLLNRIHTDMGQQGYDEMHVHHEGEYITVHRVHPKSRKGYFLIAHTAFPGYGDHRGSFHPVHLTGTKAKMIGSWTFKVDVSEGSKLEVLSDKKVLRGLPSRVSDLQGFTLDVGEEDVTITVPQKFPPGSIALFETWIQSVRDADGLDGFATTGAREAFEHITLIDLNSILYRCEAEERDSSDNKDGVYVIPKFGPLVYAGLQGWWSVLKDIIRKNDLAHPLCQHLREGQWPLDYTVGRLERMSKHQGFEALKEPADWLKLRFNAIRKVPSFLLPRYFALVIRTAYNAAWNRGLALMGEDVRSGQLFQKKLAMVSVQQTGIVKSTSLYTGKSVPCLAAGLPHFAVDWARCWGRDVFIALRGLFLGTGRYADAKEHILAFASVLKHGMIPNLLDGGKRPRYNSRDSIWFFLQSIQDYTKIAPDGLDILKETVPRRFLPYDDAWFEVEDPRAYSRSSTIEDIIQEALQRHANGISFREANAGLGLDMQMKSEGFQVDIKADWESGFVFGGSQFNCGTWMDKMGESEKAGTKGMPATPRDGAAIEITGMLYSVLAWVEELANEGKYKYSGVTLGDGGSRTLTFKDWATKIEKSFDRAYYVPLDAKEDDLYDVNPKVVNRRGIYKDLYRSGNEHEDYQFRPNFTIAMCVAPKLFDPTKALHVLSIADSVLRGPTGMATLDPKDENYHPNYNNSEDSDNPATSKGRNYHQGPEWLWPTGFFLRALLRFDLMRRNTLEERIEAFQQITRRLDGCVKAIDESPWAGLAELTNKNGEFCADSAWSAGCLIDLFHDGKRMFH